MNKLINIIIGIILFFAIAIPFGKEYFSFHYKKENILNKQNILQEKLKNFNIHKIKILENTEIYYSLGKENISKKIIQKIKNAKKNIYIEVYLFTHKNIRQAVIMAKKRGVDVKIILEKNIYKSANLNMKTFLEFKKNGIEVVWSNPKNFKLNHSKIIIIDDLLILSSGNLTYSTFTKNSDFFIFAKDFNLKEKFKKIFLSDFNGKKDYIYDHNIILSPDYTKEKFDILLDSCKFSLKMYIPSIGDKFLKKIINLQNKKIEIIIDDRETNLENIEKLKKAGINVKLHKNIHAKAFLIDEKILFIGSINFNKNSITKNREMGILIKNSEIIKNFLEIFYFNKKSDLKLDDR